MTMRAWLTVFLLWAGSVLLHAQAPWSLDTTFRTRIDAINVNSILVEEDGGLILSGRMRFPDNTNVFRLAKVNSSGELDLSFNRSGLGGSTMNRWEDRFYVETDQTVRRILPSGFQDPTFIEMNAGRYFASLQAGDYHVYPDGRVLLSGAHELRDSIRGFEGLYNLIWFSNTGYLDTTRAHHRGNGVTDEIHELPDGRFLVSGTQTSWEGVPVSKIFRVMPDGTLDPSFNTGINWGVAHCFLPLPDGRVYVGGRFRRSGFPNDTLRLVRLFADGTLDETFRAPPMAYVDFPDGLNIGPGVTLVHRFDNGNLLVQGSFERVDGEARKRICLLDSTGQLLPAFDGCGVEMFVYQGIYQGGLGGYLETEDGMAYIWGAYHGYNDGTTNDTLQRLVSRLYGPDWPTVVVEEAEEERRFTMYPNPTDGLVTFTYKFLTQPEQAFVLVQDATGRSVANLPMLATEAQLLLDTRELAKGVYTVSYTDHGEVLQLDKLIIQ